MQIIHMEKYTEIKYSQALKLDVVLLNMYYELIYDSQICED